MRVGKMAVIVGAAMMLVAPAHADFVLGNARPASLQAAAASSLDEPAQMPQQTVPRFKVARGFGDAVSMAFAVRQIVPPGVRVHYGAGIDPLSLVSWKGDQPWNRALAAAVHPLHLRLVTGIDTVLITR